MPGSQIPPNAAQGAGQEEDGIKSAGQQGLDKLVILFLGWFSNLLAPLLALGEKKKERESETE